jgi:serine phosphatase RsbU (regulator of sigma subunit)
MILYTDGFLEAKSPEGEVFGEERFAAALVTPAALGAEELASRVVEEVERFAAGKLDDDLTMLVVEFVGAPSAEEAPAEQLAGRERTGEEAWHSRK